MSAELLLLLHDNKHQEPRDVRIINSLFLLLKESTRCHVELLTDSAHDFLQDVSFDLSHHDILDDSTSLHLQTRSIFDDIVFFYFCVQRSILFCLQLDLSSCVMC